MSPTGAIARLPSPDLKSRPPEGPMSSLLLVFLFLISAPAYGEWMPLGEGKLGHTQYVDGDTVRRSSARVKLWVMHDYENPQQTMHGKVLDCEEERSRSLYMLMHAGHMGGGTLLYSGTVDDSWKPIPPGPLQSHLWNSFCGKR